MGNSLLKHYLDRAQHNHNSGFLMKGGKRKQRQEESWPKKKKKKVKKLLKPAYSFSQAQNVKLVDQIPDTLYRGSFFS